MAAERALCCLQNEPGESAEATVSAPRAHRIAKLEKVVTVVFPALRLQAKRDYAARKKFDVTAPAPVKLGCSNLGDLCFLGRRTRCNRQTGRPDSRSYLEDAPRHRPANCRRRHALPRDVRHTEPPPICVGGCLLAGQNSKSGNIRPHPAVRGLPDEITSATLTA